MHHLVAALDGGEDLVPLAFDVGPAGVQAGLEAGLLQYALARRHVRPMDFTGKPLTGYVYVAPAGVRTAASLKAWVDRGLEFARTLPPKT